MNVTQLKNHQEASAYLARMLTHQIQVTPESRIILASGGTPSLAYEMAGEQLLGVDTSRVTIIKLDEWVGLPEASSSSCEYQLMNEVIKPWRIEPHHYLSFDGAAHDILNEAERVSGLLAACQPAHLCVLGIGLNGHIGFLEPSPSLPYRSSVVSLHAMSKNHPMVKNQYEVSLGITIGIGDIMECEKVVLVATGEHKQQILARLLESDISTSLPASLLKLHPNVELIVDDKALRPMERKEWSL
ncbi:glucosamine-6-phosphate deaminase [Vibrio sp. S9_S30]|uniref:6-phosphogluconolactonase n=1 Tax=Vibrio sp. S9_S30 TaxID=2720226 RepID=UPI001680CF30|nr:6-phosphogluconolactonase [Vibrio sp. S9_S30]MBD1556142.1 glucosamine-6-phosphate deaminase [Vibrio sp. S9_S30]